MTFKDQIIGESLRHLDVLREEVARLESFISRWESLRRGSTLSARAWADKTGIVEDWKETALTLRKLEAGAADLLAITYALPDSLGIPSL